MHSSDASSPLISFSFFSQCLPLKAEVRTRNDVVTAKMPGNAVSFCAVTSHRIDSIPIDMRVSCYIFCSYVLSMRVADFVSFGLSLPFLIDSSFDCDCEHFALRMFCRILTSRKGLLWRSWWTTGPRTTSTVSGRRKARIRYGCGRFQICLLYTLQWYFILF